MRFSANLSMLFTDRPFLDRFVAAAEAGFGAVEFWWPGSDVAGVVQAASDSGVDVIAFNFDAGDMLKGDRGLIADADRVEEFRANVPVALEVAQQLGCRQLNALVGQAIAGRSPRGQLELAAEGVRWAATEALPAGITILVEALNTYENGPYLLTSTAAAERFISRVACENVRLQYDAYHMQRMEGNLTPTIRKHFGLIGHVQIADSPGRGEPGTGEINYGFVLAELERLGYRGHVGLEYRPVGGPGATLAGLRWLDEIGLEQWRGAQ